MEIVPFGNNILIKPIINKQLLVNQAISLCEYGDVIAIGKDVKEVKVGMRLGYTIFGINSLEIENEKYYFLPETSEFILGEIKM